MSLCLPVDIESLGLGLNVTSSGTPSLHLQICQILISVLYLGGIYPKCLSGSYLKSRLAHMNNQLGLGLSVLLCDTG